MTYIDLTRQFPKQSSRDNEYILVSYHYDSNYILGIPIKNRKGSTIITVWEHLHQIFSKVSIALEYYVLNETLKDLINSFEEERIKYQLVTPYKYRNN